MLLVIKQEWRYFLLALGFFTRIPVPNFADFEEDELNGSAKYFPLIGVIAGIAGIVSFYLANQILPQTIAVLISMASTIYLTGAFHEDGLADSADAFGGGWEREEVLTIMQDSRLGTYGAAALFFMLFAKFQTLNSMFPVLVSIALLVGHALSRLCAVWVMATATYVKSTGKAKPLATQIKNGDLLVANLFGLLPYVAMFVLLLVSFDDVHHMALDFVWMTLLPVIASWVWWRAKLLKRIGGYTGDTLGAMQQISELAFYLGLLAWSIKFQGYF